MSFVQRRKFLWVLFLIGVGLIGAVAAMGTTLAAMRFDELAQRATAVVRLRCLGAHSLVERGEIWTETRFETMTAEKGVIGGLVTVRMPGGRMDGLHARVDGVPEFAAGEEVYLFLWNGSDEEGGVKPPQQQWGHGAFRVLGWTQGTFRIRRDEKSGRESVTQDSANAAVFDRDTRTFRHEGIREMGVNEFRSKLRAALERRE